MRVLGQKSAKQHAKYDSLVTLVVRSRDTPGRVVRMRLTDVSLVIVAAMWILGNTYLLIKIVLFCKLPYC